MSLYPESYFGKENDDDDDDGGQQEAFNRISGILSNLLEEANNAIHGVENENNSDADASDKREQEDYSNNNIRSSSPAQRGSRHMHPSRLPRPIYTKSRRSSNLSIASSSSCSVYSQTDSLFSPASSTSSRATSPTMSIESRPSSPQKLMVATTVSPTMVVKKRTSRPLSCPVLMARRSSGEGGNIRQQQQQQQQQRMRRASAVVLRDPLVESYKRLDSSMALVESLSRDLAASDKKMQQVKQQQQPSSALRLSALLILPFLHIPHALISMVFDSLSTKDPNNLTGMIAWGIFFALANVMVDRVIYPTRQKMVDIDTTTTTTTATTTTDKLPPQQQQHTPAMYIVKRRSRIRSCMDPFFDRYNSE
ncbi:hypothetical protein K492DRAFT_180492 [Lichtheimia hyalospora FSU 10163]|nr:hypothetical protein K492DRAFT_180492 [Lichtheimia hyalospora FSU 10163]